MMRLGNAGQHIKALAICRKHSRPYYDSIFGLTKLASVTAYSTSSICILNVDEQDPIVSLFALLTLLHDTVRVTWTNILILMVNIPILIHSHFMSPGEHHPRTVRIHCFTTFVNSKRNIIRANTTNA